jgi:hypothetical protein
MSELLNVRQVLPYLALFLDASPDVAREAERLGVTHADIQDVDRYLEAMDLGDIKGL